MSNNRVHNKGLYGLRDEAIATEAITPGHLALRHTATGVKKHATAGGNVNPLFALEREMTGDDKDTAYASGDSVLLLYPQRGSRISAIVAAGAAAIAVNDPLESAGDGTLRKHTAPSQAVDEGGSATYTIAPKTMAIVAFAREAVDNSLGSDPVRIDIEVA